MLAGECGEVMIRDLVRTRNALAMCDVSRQAWQVRYGDAIATAEAITLEGVRVPFLSLEMLIKSKTTCREQEHADLVRLRDLLELKRQRGDAGN